MLGRGRETDGSLHLEGKHLKSLQSHNKETRRRLPYIDLNKWKETDADQLIAQLDYQPLTAESLTSSIKSQSHDSVGSSVVSCFILKSLTLMCRVLPSASSYVPRVFTESHVVILAFCTSCFFRGDSWILDYFVFC